MTADWLYDLSFISFIVCDWSVNAVCSTCWLYHNRTVFLCIVTILSDHACYMATLCRYIDFMNTLWYLLITTWTNEWSSFIELFKQTQFVWFSVDHHGKSYWILTFYSTRVYMYMYQFNKIKFKLTSVSYWVEQRLDV